MKQVLVLVRSRHSAITLEHWLSAHQDQIDWRFEVCDLFGADPGSDGHRITRVFLAYADWLEERLDPQSASEIPDCLVLTDFAGYDVVQPADLHPSNHRGWKSVLGMLILAFPEVDWIFSGAKLGQQSPWPAGAHGTHFVFDGSDLKLEERFASFDRRLHPLFDPTGLRNAIRHSKPENDKDTFNAYAERREAALAIDEERDFAWFHAYSAYRFGFRAAAITTFRGMEAALDSPKPAGDPQVVFEDVFLFFPDYHSECFSWLQNRDKNFKDLAAVPHRILVTSGHGRGRRLEEDGKANQKNSSSCEKHWKTNEEYLRDLRANGKCNRILHKPLGGMFDLWNDSRLAKRLCKYTVPPQRPPCPAPGFRWPPPKEEKEDKKGHSAPGRLLMIADRLIARAIRMPRDTLSVRQAAYGALLSTDALELLGHRTPTTSLDAVGLKHQYEALAECLFSGTQQHMDVEARIADIDRELRALSRWFGASPRQRETSRRNAELSILNGLIDIYRRHNQFDEEHTLQVRARYLHRKLRFSKLPSVFRPLEVFPWYIEKLLVSLPTFFGSIAGWIVLFGALLMVLHDLPLHRAMADAFASFLSMEPPGDEAVWHWKQGWNDAFWLVAMIVGVGFLHLGIFISHLYSMISRK